jgi:hypothetical protein
MLLFIDDSPGWPQSGLFLCGDLMETTMTRKSLITACAILVSCWLAMPAVAGALAVLDHFDLNRIDQRIWQVEAPAGNVSVANSKLEFLSSPTAAYASLWTKAEYQGDFEVILDWREFATSATNFSGNDRLISLQVTSKAHTGNLVFIFRGKSGNGNNYFSSGQINGVFPPNGASAPVGASEGFLKIVRIGSTITTAYSEGGVWHPLGSFPNYFTDGVALQIMSYTGANETFHVASDSLSVQAQQVVAMPFPDIKAQGADVLTGPVPSFHPLNVAITLGPGAYPGYVADWWVAASTPMGMYWFTLDQGWVRSDGAIPVYVGGLCDLATYPVLNAQGLPAGNYTFYFGVDPGGNSLDMDNLIVDWVDVTLQ